MLMLCNVNIQNQNSNLAATASQTQNCNLKLAASQPPYLNCNPNGSQISCSVQVQVSSVELASSDSKLRPENMNAANGIFHCNGLCLGCPLALGQAPKRIPPNQHPDPAKQNFLKGRNGGSDLELPQSFDFCKRCWANSLEFKLQLFFTHSFNNSDGFSPILSSTSKTLGKPTAVACCIGPPRYRGQL